MFGRSSKESMAAVGREVSKAQSTRSEQRHGEIVDLTDSKSESGNESIDSDRPLAYHSQAVRTRIDSEIKAHSPTKATTPTATTLIGDVALNNTSLPEDHEPKYLPQARRDYPSIRPPFVRLNRNKGVLGPKRVTFATPDGQIPQRDVPTTLATRAWDAISSFYTLDINGERLIVKPIGGRFNHTDRGSTQYRAWTGQGNAYESTPVAFEIKDDAEDQQRNVKDSDGNLERKVEDIMVDDLDAVDDEDYVPPSSEGSSTKNDSQQRSGLQGTTRKSYSPEPLAIGAQLTHLNASHDDGSPRGSEARLSIGVEPTARAKFSISQPRLSEASAAAPRVSEIAAGKRPAPDVPQGSRSSKKGRPEREDTTIHNTANARVPPHPDDVQARTYNTIRLSPGLCVEYGSNQALLCYEHSGPF